MKRRDFFRKGRSLYTINQFPGKRVYGERLFFFDRCEYREWDPNKSKLGAALMNSNKIDVDVFRKRSILYLGASSGTTVSHLSDLCQRRVYAVEVSFEMGIYLVALSRERENIYPVIEDARELNKIKKKLNGDEIGSVIQDIPGKFQTELMLDVGSKLLKRGTQVFYSIKLSSIASNRSLKEILDDELSKLRKVYEIVHIISLKPFEKNHYMLVMRKK